MWLYGWFTCLQNASYLTITCWIPCIFCALSSETYNIAQNFAHMNANPDQKPFEQTFVLQQHNRFECIYAVWSAASLVRSELI